MTLFEIIKIIKDIALVQPNVRTASNGDIFDTLNGNPNVKYGVVHVNQTTHNETETTDNYGLNVFYVDRLEVDKSNQLQIQSIGKNIISNIIKVLCEQFDVDCPNITYTPFTERFKDECAGVYANLTIQVVKDYSCGEQYGEWVKPQIVVINNIDATFTENGVYEVPQGYTGYGKITVDLDIPTVQSSITITENGIYHAEQPFNCVEEIIVEVPDLNGDYNEGYSDGYTQGEIEGFNDGYNDGYVEGIEEQKSLLESITITENGVYSREDGYNEVEVNVTVKRPIPNGLKLRNSTFTEFDFANNDWSNVRDYTYMFKDCKNLTNIYNFPQTNDYILLESTFENSNKIENIDLSNNKVVDFTKTFNGCSNIKEINLTNCNTEYLCSLEVAFSYCYNLENIIGLGELDVSNVQSFDRAFSHCNRLDVTPIQNWNVTNKITYLGSFLTNCGFNRDSLQSLDLSNWDVSNVTGFNSLFYDSKFDTINISNWNMSKWNATGTNYGNTLSFATLNNLIMDDVILPPTRTTLSSLFSNKAINNISLKGLCTSNITDISNMFKDAKLQSLDLSNWVTSNVANVASTFQGCTNLQSLDLTSWDLSNCTEMRSLFNYCTNLTEIIGLNDLNVNNVRYINNLFEDCQSITSIDISNWNLSNVSAMQALFKDCYNLTEIKFGGDIKPNVDVYAMFQNINITGTLYYPQQYAENYQNIINALPINWVAISY